jgi:toxin ParE1/3/4
MKLVWAEQAQQEWVAQYRFYFARNPDAARRMRQLVMEGARQLRAHPKIGRPGRVEGSRELVISGTPFLLVYDENPARVEIVHVYHRRQNRSEE